MAEMDEKFGEFLRRKSANKIKTPREAVKADFDSYHASVMAVHEIAREMKAENAEKYEGDPEMLVRANEAVDEWVRRRM